MRKKYFFIVLMTFCSFLCSCSFLFPQSEGNAFNKNKQWCFLVYMCADNNLEAYGIRDLLEMERSKLNTKEVSVLILMDRNPDYDTSNENWSGTKLYELKACNSKNNTDIQSKELDCKKLGLGVKENIELDMASEYVLSSVLSFMKDNYKADYYGLIMWGHGTGWRSQEDTKGFAYDSTSGSYMSLKSLAKAIREGDLKLDFIGFDTCFGGELEVMYELRNLCDYGAGSEGLVASTGWNYEELWNLFEISTDKSPEDFCEICVRQFRNSYRNLKGASFTAIKFSELQEYVNSFEAFMKEASCFINNIKTRDGIINRIINCEQLYCEKKQGSDVYIDLIALCNLIYEEIQGSEDYLNYETKLLKSLLEKFMQVNSNFVVSSWANTGEISGLGIYVGTLAPSGLLSAVHPAGYIKDKTSSQIDFVQNTQWYVPTMNKNTSFMDKLFYTPYL